ncbi:mucin-5AC-like [Durio zibethinus]|uniref:Mucin-5AC-like n=1 Tax=Durio zibethinus TaxID=66656 RepID=A0A6P6AJH7_DURZI|nr:mucin-5AC-like [Durio zibethinus]
MMNRSFRSQQEKAMQAAALKQQQQLRASMMKEKEDELALFLEMRKREKEQSNLLLNHSSEGIDASLGSKPGTSPIFNLSAPTTTSARKTGGAADDFLNSDSDKNDYDWLLTPPGTPLFPSLEMESQKTVMSQIGNPKAHPTALKSRLANPQPDSAARGNLASKQLALSPGLNSTGIRRPSSSGGPGSRPTTPTRRPTLTGASKPMRSSTQNLGPLSSTKSSISATKPITSAAKPVISATKPATKPGTSTTKPTVSAAKTGSSATKPTVFARSSTPTRSTARSSTPTARPTLPSSKPVSRATTPTRRPSTLSSAPNISASPIKLSLSFTKPTSAASRNSVPSRAASPTVKSRSWKPSEMPGFSLDAPPNLRTTLPDRPLSATRGRPGAPSSRSSSVEPGPTARPRRQSCSPSRGRPPNGAMLHVSGSSVPAVSRGYSKVSDNLSPVVIGTKMVERVINMRKLAPPKQDDKHSPHGNMSGKSASPDSSGFGRTLSKKSLDMAIRHMDIRRTIPGNLRPLMTNIPASSMYSVRSGPTRSRNISVSDSPLATSSNGSSELSVNNNCICLDGNEVEDDNGSERGGRSPASMHAR